jgi:hypothetical protein
VPSARPVAAAAALCTLPVMPVLSCIVPSNERLICNLLSTSLLQSRFATSISCIPEASLTSVANSPVSIYRI